MDRPGLPLDPLGAQQLFEVGESKGYAAFLDGDKPDKNDWLIPGFSEGYNDAKENEGRKNAGEDRFDQPQFDR